MAVGGIPAGGPGATPGATPDAASGAASGAAPSGAASSAAGGAGGAAAPLQMGSQLLSGEINDTNQLKNQSVSQTQQDAQATLDNTTTKAFDVSPQAQHSVKAGAQTQT